MDSRLPKSFCQVAGIFSCVEKELKRHGELSRMIPPFKASSRSVQEVQVQEQFGE